MTFQQYYQAALRHGWFDVCFYFDLLQSRGMSIRHSDLSLFEHYATIGWKRGLSPSIRFSVERYLAEYQDVAESQVDPLYHYLVRGRKERRKAFALFEWPAEVHVAGLTESRRFAASILAAGKLPVVFLCGGAAGEQRLIPRLITSLGEAGLVDCFMIVDGAQTSGIQRQASGFELGALDASGWTREQKVDHLAELLSTRADVVVVSDSLATADLLAPFAAREHRIVSFLHDFPGRVELPAQGAAASEIKRCAHRIIVTSDLVREHVGAACAIPRDDMQVIQPPPDMSRDPSWIRYVGDVEHCLRGLGNAGSKLRSRRGTVGRQEVADDLCVIIPSYNHKQFILEALDSILAQSVRPKEIRIIDDGSSDGSAELVQSLACDELGISVRARENRGAPATINEAIAETACPIVAVMNSDDRWHPLRIERLIDNLRRGGGDAVFSRLRFIGPQYRCDHKRTWYERGVDNYRSGSPLWLALMSFNIFYTTSNLMVRRDKFLDVGGFGPLRYCHDVDYMLKAIFAGQQIRFVEESLCEYRLHDSNTIDEDWAKVRFEDAWVVARFMQRNHRRLNEAQKLSVAKRICGKNLATSVLGILRAAVYDAKPLDDSRMHNEPVWRDSLDHAHEHAGKAVEPRQLLQAMMQLLVTPSAGAASTAGA